MACIACIACIACTACTACMAWIRWVEASECILKAQIGVVIRIPTDPCVEAVDDMATFSRLGGVNWIAASHLRIGRTHFNDASDCTCNTLPCHCFTSQTQNELDGSSVRSSGSPPAPRASSQVFSSEALSGQHCSSARSSGSPPAPLVSSQVFDREDLSGNRTWAHLAFKSDRECTKERYVTKLRRISLQFRDVKTNLWRHETQRISLQFHDVLTLVFDLRFVVHFGQDCIIKRTQYRVTFVTSRLYCYECVNLLCFRMV